MPTSVPSWLCSRICKLADLEARHIADVPELDGTCKLLDHCTLDCTFTYEQPRDCPTCSLAAMRLPNMQCGNTACCCRGGLTSEKKGARHIVLLAASASISWVFAKSILNASLLGGEYGIVGACAYGNFASLQTWPGAARVNIPACFD